MKYIKLTWQFCQDFSDYYRNCEESILTNTETVFKSFLDTHPQHGMPDITTPTENKEREELLMVASRLAQGILSNPHYAEQINGNNWEPATELVVSTSMIIAIEIRNAVNAACEKKEDKA